MSLLVDCRFQDGALVKGMKQVRVRQNSNLSSKATARKGGRERERVKEAIEDRKQPPFSLSLSPSRYPFARLPFCNLRSAQLLASSYSIRFFLVAVAFTEQLVMQEKVIVNA